MMKLGKYQVIELLGSGATADVYRAMDTVLEREVALKVLKPSLVYDNTAYTRFLREARSAANLFHPNIATILDTAEVEGRYFIAMRYIEGKSLDRILKDEGALSHNEVMHLVKDVGSALHYAHQRGFLHRDIKPSNIIRSVQGEYFLTDFGLVRALMETGMTSHTGAILGTPTYIPPEIWLNQPVTPAMDQYALACVIYEAYTGKILFNGDTPPAIMTAHVLKGYGSLEGLPDAMKVPMQKALSRLAEERYSDIQSFVDALSLPKAETGKTESSGLREEHPAPIKPEVRIGEGKDNSPLKKGPIQASSPLEESGVSGIEDVAPPKSEPVLHSTTRSEGMVRNEYATGKVINPYPTPKPGMWRRFVTWFDELFISGAVLPPSPSGKKRWAFWPSIAYFLLLSVTVLTTSEGLGYDLLYVRGISYQASIFLFLLILSGVFYGWVLVTILKELYVIPKPILIILGWTLAWLVNYYHFLRLNITLSGNVYGIKGVIGGLVLALSLWRSYRLNWKEIFFITFSWGIGFFLATSIHYGSITLIIKGLLEVFLGSLVTMAILHRARKRLRELPGSTDPSSPNFSTIAADYDSRKQRKIGTHKVLSPALLYIVMASSTVWMILILWLLLGMR